MDHATIRRYFRRVISVDEALKRGWLPGPLLSIAKDFRVSSIMERRAIPRKPVLMSGAIAFAGSAINCLIRNISISGAALDVPNPDNIPECFDLVFKADGTHIPCHVVWRQDERIGVAFD
jgi:hypothetical protein